MYARVCALLQRKLGTVKGEAAGEGGGGFGRPKDGGKRTRSSRWRQRTAVGSSGWQRSNGRATAAIVVVVVVAVVVVRGGGEGRGPGRAGDGEEEVEKEEVESEGAGGGGRSVETRRCRRRRVSPVGWVGLVCTSTTPAPTWFQAKERMG